MRIMCFTILSLLVLAFAIPAAADCSICVTTVTVNADGTSQQTDAQCEPNPTGDIADCRAFNMRGNAYCDSMSLVASCGEGISGCPPWAWNCGVIQYTTVRRMHSLIRRILSVV